MCLKRGDACTIVADWMFFCVSDGHVVELEGCNACKTEGFPSHWEKGMIMTTLTGKTLKKNTIRMYMIPNHFGYAASLK